MPPVGTDKPRCARCLRPVDRIEQSRVPGTDGLTITAFCHGAIESVTLTGEDLLRAGKFSFRFTVAFSNTRTAEQRVADGTARRRAQDLSRAAELDAARRRAQDLYRRVHETGTTRMPPRPFIRGPGMAEAMHVSAAAAFRSAAGTAPAHATHVIIDDPIKSSPEPTFRLHTPGDEFKMPSVGEYVFRMFRGGRR